LCPRAVKVEPLFPAMLRFVRFALLALPVASEVSLDSALKEDDCGDGECVLNAIQLKGLKKEQSVGEDLYEELQEGDESWLKDINSKTKNHFKHILAPLQKPIVTNYQYLAELEKFVNYTMMKIENATGRAVIWNRKSLLQEDEDEESDEVSDEELQSSYGRRRRSIKGEDLPPRARYINKILIYLNKEMEAVWNYNTIVDRKRWGVGNTITSSPYGPHGEHPKRWRANVTVPFPTHAPVSPVLNVNNSLTMHMKAEDRKYDNKYAMQLQADYQSLIDNINDASKKCNDLRKRLYKMDAYADKFIKLPSGVWNKIDAQS